MKYIIRICLALAGVCLVPGMLCLVLGAAMGGDLRQAAQYAHIGPGGRGFSLVSWSDYDDIFWDGYYIPAPEAPEAPQAPEAPSAPEAPLIGAAVGDQNQRLEGYNNTPNSAPTQVARATKLDFELSGVRDVVIASGKGFGVYIDSQVRGFETRMDGTTWELKTSGKNRTTGSMTIILPEGFTFEDVEITLGAGEISGSGLRATELEFTAGAGSISMTDVWADKLELKAEAGNVEVSGDVGHTVDITAEAGYVSLNMPRPEDYGYEVECSMGHVSLGGDDFTALQSSHSANLSAPLLFEIECSVGGVEVSFD